MSKRFFTKINNKGRLVIIDKECHIELFDMALACEVLNRLDLKLKTYNEQLGEQQATISALKEENEQLRGINKEIGDDLHNCRLNKDIVSEKLKLWQDTLAEYDIYTIKDFKELMKNDN